MQSARSSQQWGTVVFPVIQAVASVLKAPAATREIAPLRLCPADAASSSGKRPASRLIGPGGAIAFTGVLFTTPRRRYTLSSLMLCLVALGVALLPTGCGISSAIVRPVTSLSPTITGLSSTAATDGSAALNLTINGTNFTSAATARWNATPLATTYVRATQVTAVVPTGLAAVATAGDTGTEASIDLSWQPVTDSDLAGYTIYRSESGGAWRRISPAEPVVPPAYHDAQVQPGHTYSYAVSAIDQLGHESARSAETEETVPQP